MVDGISVIGSWEGVAVYPCMDFIAPSLTCDSKDLRCDSEIASPPVLKFFKAMYVIIVQVVLISHSFLMAGMGWPSVLNIEAMMVRSS